MFCILKIGGNVFVNLVEFDKVFVFFVFYEGLVILVYGGGCKVSELLKLMGYMFKMINGCCIIDEFILEVVIMVYVGLLNKQLVVQLQVLNCNVIGLSGVDGNLIWVYK